MSDYEWKGSITFGGNPDRLLKRIQELEAGNTELTATLEAVRGSIEGLITLWFATREHGCLPVAVIKATAAVKIIDAALATTTSMEQSHE